MVYEYLHDFKLLFFQQEIVDDDFEIIEDI